VPYLQPFTDGNKRTSRLLANAVLLAQDYPPVSFFTADETTYKAGRRRSAPVPVPQCR
jgi:Fic family protein